MEGIDLSKDKYGRIVTVRLDDDLYEQLVDTLRDNPYLYVSFSHFIRCAIIEKLRPSADSDFGVGRMFVRWLRDSFNEYNKERKEQ